MTAKLNEALQRYRRLTLEMAVGDLMWRHAGGGSNHGPVIKLMQARADVLEAASNLSGEQFTAALMESGFLFSETNT